MGNHVAPGIPPLLAKNWQPVPDRPNSFRNKVTFQYTHKHIINIEDPMQIQSFKLRMKQTNAYICRVLFYHQYHDSIYHVYTDQIHLQPNITKSDVWKGQKIKIVQSFGQLAQIYGFMKVCRQMIGADSNGHPKIWIHPDPVCSKPWAYSNSQTAMLADILTMFQNIQQKSGTLKPKKQANRSITSTAHQQYTTFSQYIRSQIQALNSEYVLNAQNAQAKTKGNRNSAFVENSTSSTNIEMDKKKKNMNKTYVQNINQNKNSDFHYYGRQPRFSNTIDYKEQINNITKPNILQKLFNPTVCETSRDEQNYVRIPGHSPYANTKKNNERKNLSLERPVTYTNNASMQNQKKYMEENYRTQNEKPAVMKRRDTQNFKILLQSTPNQNILKQREDKSKSMTTGVHPRLPTKKSTLNIDQQINQKSLKKSPLGKLMTQTSQTFKPNTVPIYSPVNYQRQNNRENKTLQGFYHAKNLDSTINNSKVSMNKTHQGHHFHKKQMKNASIPNFLMKSNTELVKQMWESAPTNDKHPSTQRQKRENNEVQPKQFKVLQISQSNLLLDNSNHDSQQPHPGMRERKNTAAILKEQLHNILESPIQPEPRPVSIDYQNFKSVKMFYRQPHFEEEIEYQSSEKDQFDVIKQKVEQKKARFAQLKLDAKKILQDSI